MNNISAVLFDFGNVLSGPPSPAVWAQMREHSGLDESTLQREYWAYRDDYDSGALDGEGYWNRIAAGAGTRFTEETRAHLTRLDVELWTEMNLPMLAWVRRLHAAGVRTGILSNMPSPMAEGICGKFDWIGDFHHAVWSHALKMRKPEPEIYAAAVEGLGVPANEILFLDDREDNIQAAEALGMQGLVYTTHAAFEEEMERRGYQFLLHPETVAEDRL